MRDVYITSETWSFACLRCDHSWDEEYEARHTGDSSGGEVVTWRRHGLACLPPWGGRNCPNCSGYRVKQLPRRTPPRDREQRPTSQEPPDASAAHTSTRPVGSVSAILR